MDKELDKRVIVDGDWTLVWSVFADKPYADIWHRPCNNSYGIEIHGVCNVCKKEVPKGILMMQKLKESNI